MLARHEVPEPGRAPRTRCSRRSTQSSRRSATTVSRRSATASRRTSTAATGRDPGRREPPARGRRLRGHAVADRFGLRSAIGNDANAAALAEWRLGAGTGLVDIVMLTLGTGVGGGVVLDGRLYRAVGGARPRRRRHGGPPCQGTARPRPSRGARVGHCGRPGRARAVRPGARTRTCSSRERAREGRGAGEAARAIGRSLGAAIGSFVNVFDPELVVIGGGFGAAAGGLVLDPAQESARREALDPASDVRVVPAELGGDAGLVGAGLVAFEALDGTCVRCRSRSARRRSGTSRTSPFASSRSFARQISSSARTRGARASCSSATESRLGSSSYHRHNEAARTPRCSAAARGGERIALVSDAGLPGVNDPGSRLIAAARRCRRRGDRAPRPLRGRDGTRGERVRRRSATSSSATCHGEQVSCGRWRRSSPPGPAQSVAFESPRRLPASLAMLAEELRGGAVLPCAASSRSASRRSRAGRSGSSRRGTPSRRRAR